MLGEDDSRWTWMGDYRFETPPFLVDEMHKLMRETFGDKFVDILEATIPPPFGTLDVDSKSKQE